MFLTKGCQTPVLREECKILLLLICFLAQMDRVLFSKEPFQHFLWGVARKALC